MTRPRKPTALLELKGAFVKDPQRRRSREREPIAEGDAVKPRFVKGVAARIWNEYGPRVAAMGLLKAVDAFNFAVWCCLAAEFEKGAERMPAARIAQMRQVGERFGLDAGARAKLAVVEPAKNDEDDPAEKYFAESESRRLARLKARQSIGS